LDPSQTGLGYGLGRVADMQVCVPTARVEEALEILAEDLERQGLEHRVLEAQSPEEQLRSRLAADGVLIQVLGVLSLTGIPLFFSLAGAWKGMQYLRACDELTERPSAHRYTLGAIALAVLTIPWGLFVAYRLIERIWV